MANGVDANLWLETAPNHPLKRNKTLAVSSGNELSQNCLDAWQAFVNSLDTTVVFDGYALQSTVRFLYANCATHSHIAEYFSSWQELASEATLVFFSVENTREHFEVVCEERGSEWTAKLYEYVENTPIGVVNGFKGREGFLEFWSNYQLLCLELLSGASVPVHVAGARSWSDGDFEVLASRVGLVSER